MEGNEYSRNFGREWDSPLMEILFSFKFIVHYLCCIWNVERVIPMLIMFVPWSKWALILQAFLLHTQIHMCIYIYVVYVCFLFPWIILFLRWSLCIYINSNKYKWIYIYTLLISFNSTKILLTSTFALFWLAFFFNYKLNIYIVDRQLIQKWVLFICST